MGELQNEDDASLKHATDLASGMRVQKIFERTMGEAFTMDALEYIGCTCEDDPNSKRYPSVPCFFTFDSHWVPLRDISVSSKLSLEIGSVLEIFMDSWNHGRDEKSLGVCDHLCRYQ